MSTTLNVRHAAPPEAKPHVVRCRGHLGGHVGPECRQVLGVESDGRLYVGAVYHDQVVRLVCARCGKRKIWQPPQAPAAQAAAA